MTFADAPDMRSSQKVCVLLFSALALLAAACSSGDAVKTSPSEPSSAIETSTRWSDASPGEASGFHIGALPESLSPLASSFSKHVDVWGVHIVATEATDDASITHAANVMAQYLDNDADGEPDNPAVLSAMVENRATLLMGATPEEFESLDAEAVFAFVQDGGQDLYASETNPADGFDASLEEVHHLILNTGWSKVFPEQLGQAKGSAIADAMDIARGGQFDTIPNRYPEGAWYTYDDQTCDYTCMVTEYTYWIHTSLLGGQEGRADEIGQEWRLETSEKARSGDPMGTGILEDPVLGLPTVLPDGDYQPAAIAGGSD